MSTETLERDPTGAEFNANAAIAAEASANNMHPIELGGVNYLTNLPEGIDLFNNDSKASFPLEESLRVSELDKLPVGKFTVSGTKEVEDDIGQTHTREINREITITGTENGKVINQEALGGWELHGDSGELMNSLGYIVEDQDGRERIKAVPTPETLINAAQKLGVDVALFSDDYYIKGAEYLKAFADKKYPVSLKNYKHDIEDDHITAMVLGGEPLKIALSDVANTALSKDQATIDVMAQGLDEFTATLRNVTTYASPTLGEAYGEGQGKRTLHQAGEKIGIPAETIEEILATAQENAKQYGMEITHFS